MFKAAMGVELVFVPEANVDLDCAYAWYEKQPPGLGEQFLDCVEACPDHIVRNPIIHAMVFENYRRALVRRFPYGVFYEYSGEALTVYGVFHAARDPEKWRQRLS